MILIPEHDGDVMGVPGRFHTARAWDDERWESQKWTSEEAPFNLGGRKKWVQAEIRFDDVCENGCHTFAITGTVYGSRRINRNSQMGGRIHGILAMAFPALVPLFKWHLMNSDGPTHYFANTLYFAGNKDSNGKRKGEAISYGLGIQFGNSPLTHFYSSKFINFLQGFNAEAEYVEVPHEKKPEQFSANFTLKGHDVPWHECPFKRELEAREFCRAYNTRPHLIHKIPVAFSLGKEREFDAARDSARWPEATDEELSLPADELQKLLEARVPDLVENFRADVEQAGFLWSPA